MWGGIGNSDATANYDRSNSRVTATGIALQESIEFEQADVTFNTAVGQFQVGYQAAGEWGTGFANHPNTAPVSSCTPYRSVPSPSVPSMRGEVRHHEHRRVA